ncbi:hypothetical protein AV530_000587 [Patagioenas fasciata monilis]|uniref:Uncharacterized protein n=1 Tax=Patagioenas fasciata monilis TaxID=372326 RepID=A0A1V4IG74_PATFA|nr:hypothetical protein AV530_000587 [Patagioenas fasciata monilis]
MRGRSLLPFQSPFLLLLALGLAGAAPYSLLPPCVRVCERPALLLAPAAESRPTFSPPRSEPGELLTA